LRTERAILPGFHLCFLAVVRVPCADGQLETSQVPVEARAPREGTSISSVFSVGFLAPCSEMPRAAIAY
jgi:hypothetical protein